VTEPAAAPARDRLGPWCGGVLLAGAVMIPLIGWLAPLAFAPLLALMGLASLPALRISVPERPLAIVLSTLVIWAAVSTLWSPFVPEDLEGATALKLVAELVLAWAAVCGARRADPILRGRALRLLAWGMALFGLVLLAEAASGGQIYRGLREALGDPIRADLGRKNLAQASFVLALLWPIVTVAGLRAGAPAWLGLPMAAGAAAVAWVFLSDAPVIAIGLSLGVGVAVQAWPRLGPKVMAGVAALAFLAAPWVVLALRDLAGSQGWTVTPPPSWAQRIGYWNHAVDWIAEHPWRGWGLDASRAFGPGIQLHPHNAALQVWLELGVAGAGLAAAAWGLILWRLARPRADLLAVGAAGSAAAYLLFSLVNFGVWQEWWLALGALVIHLHVAASRIEAAPGRGKEST
jgi:O-antigen ligase